MPTAIKKLVKDKKVEVEEEKGGETPSAGNKIKTAIEKNIGEKIVKTIGKKTGKDDDGDDPIAQSLK